MGRHKSTERNGRERHTKGKRTREGRQKHRAEEV